jgi:hypothetical protein
MRMMRWVRGRRVIDVDVDVDIDVGGLSIALGWRFWT